MIKIENPFKKWPFLRKSWVLINNVGALIKTIKEVGETQNLDAIKEKYKRIMTQKIIGKEKKKFVAGSNDEKISTIIKVWLVPILNFEGLQFN